MLKYTESLEMSAKLEIKKIIEIFNNKSKKEIEDNEEKYAVNSALLYRIQGQVFTDTTHQRRSYPMLLLIQI